MKKGAREEAGREKRRGREVRVGYMKMLNGNLRRWDEWKEEWMGKVREAEEGSGNAGMKGERREGMLGFGRGEKREAKGRSVKVGVKLGEEGRMRFAQETQRIGRGGERMSREDWRQ